MLVSIAVGVGLSSMPVIVCDVPSPSWFVEVHLRMPAIRLKKTASFALAPPIP